MQTGTTSGPSRTAGHTDWPPSERGQEPHHLDESPGKRTGAKTGIAPGSDPALYLPAIEPIDSRVSPTARCTSGTAHGEASEGRGALPGAQA